MPKREKTTKTKNNFRKEIAAVFGFLGKASRRLAATKSAFRVATAHEIASTGRIFDKVELFSRGDALGKGVRATDVIQKGEILASYGGRVVPKLLVSQQKYKTAYALQLTKDFVIDGNPLLPETRGHLGPLINDAAGSVRQATNNNAKFSRGFIRANGEKLHTMWVKATKTIQKGEEIYVSYGRLYWKNI